MIRNSSELRGLTSGLLDHIFSRAFDIEGYWGVGHIYRSASLCNKSTITMNLNEAYMLKDGILAIAQSYFLEWLSAQQNPAEDSTRFVNSAYLQFDFKPQQTLDQAFWDRNTFAFRGANIAIVDCTIVIISKNHRAFIRSKSDYCAMQGTGGFQRRDENHWGLCRSKASYSSVLSK